ncbi:hypothetical protein AK812_SmicGene11726 [Symbiodinium microadriaticum]|uniref:Uncharacterized protein n=1 Tax=Symbiodinium microadriaticum TaxID=2951 RepID=A0A1Q9ECJ9_SYMMI|nr:hypothetical protein AK812_SmicGene11726 [Symbiodinium microadriaticum]
MAELSLSNWPDALHLCVLQHLGSAQEVWNLLVPYGLLCRATQLAVQSPSLWSSVDLSGINEAVPLAQLRRLLTRPYLLKAEISHQAMDASTRCVLLPPLLEDGLRAYNLPLAPPCKFTPFGKEFLGDSPAGTYRLGPVELDGIIAEEEFYTASDGRVVWSSGRQAG